MEDLVSKLTIRKTIKLMFHLLFSILPIILVTKRLHEIIYGKFSVYYDGQILLNMFFEPKTYFTILIFCILILIVHVLSSISPILFYSFKTNNHRLKGGRILKYFIIIVRLN